MSTVQHPDLTIVRQALRYEDGKLYWNKRPVSHFVSAKACAIWNGQNSGNEAGYANRKVQGDRWLIHIGGKLRRRSKLVWFMHHGTWPDILDHENRNTLDDRIGNLRPATGTMNNGNTRKHRDNKSGYKGVSWSKNDNKWIAAIQVHGKRYYLGSYDDAKTAHAAYCAAAAEMFGRFAYNG